MSKVTTLGIYKVIVTTQDAFASQKYCGFISVVACACSGHGPDQLRLFFVDASCLPMGLEYLPISFLFPRADSSFRREPFLVN